MINIIKADLYRMTKSKGILIFWISLIVMFALTIFLKDNMAIGAMPIMETKMEDIKLDIRQLFFSANFYFLLIFPVYNIIVAEFSEKTIKNTISSSIDKNLYFISKFILTQIYSIGTFVLSNLVFYAANRLINGTEYSSDFGKFMSYVGWQCFVIFMLVNVLMAAAFLFAKATLFNSITIIFPFVFALIESILYSTKSTRKFAEDIILKFDFNQLFVKFASDCSYKEIHTLLTFIFIVSIAAFCIGISVFRKREIK